MYRILFLLFALLLSPMAFAGAVNVNTATASELETLPGIGASKAAAIVEYRTANGPFASVEDLQSVPGIGPATVSNLRASATVGDGTTTAAAEPAPAPAAAPDAPAPAPIAPSGSSGKINVNTASASELEALPGIGPTKSKAIVDDRDMNGPFASCDDLARVKGIGPATVSGIRDLCATE